MAETKSNVPESREWTEWDRETCRTELSLNEEEGGVVRIVARQEDEVARLEAKPQGDVLIVTTLEVQPEITVRGRGLFRRTSKAAGRNRGFGTMLVRAVAIYARRRGLKTVLAAVSAQDLAANRYLLEWYSRRGFIVERTPAAHQPGSAATLRMIL